MSIDKEKQIEEMAKTIECLDMPMTCFSDCRECEYIKERDNNWFCQELKIAKSLYDTNYRKLSKDSVVLSREEYSKNLQTHYFMGQREVEEEYKTIQIPKERKETAEKILNTDFFVFETENRSEEYQKGYMQAVRECRSRRDEMAKQLGVEIKE